MTAPAQLDAAPAQADVRRTTPAGGGLALAVVVALAAAGGAALSGAVRPSLLFDPGIGVRWGLPVLRGIADLAAALTVGALVLAAVALPAGRVGARVRAHGPALLLAAASSAVWAVATGAVLVATCVDVSTLAVDDPAFGSAIGAFVTDGAVGTGLLVTALVAAAVATLACGVRSLTGAGLLCLLALAGLVPQALGGHAAGAASHETAVTSLGLHLVGVTVWVGGLVALVLLRPGLEGAHDRSEPASPAALTAAVRRYSTMAGIAFVAVAASGLVNAWLRLPGPAGLTGGYGALLLLKTTALIALGVAGVLHRRRALPRLAEGEPGAFRRLALVEAGVMTVAIGLSAALSRTAPPLPDRPVERLTPAQVLTGYPLPDEPQALDWLLSWRPDLLWVVVAAVAAGLYAAAVHRLRARGDSWPLVRGLTWYAGLAVLLWATCGAPAIYGRVLFSAHMVGHMTVGMVVPLLLVAAAPITLALRTLPVRHDGTRGPREWLLVAVESRPLRALGHPVVAAGLFTGSLIVFYHSPLFGLALRTHVGHELMFVHFLLTGYVFVWMLVGVDPGPRRPPPAARLVVLLATMGFHAFFGVTLVSGTALLEPEWFTALGRTWGDDALADQKVGGGIAWAVGELPTLVLALLIAVQWSRSDAREARRLDRRADRDGDADLTAYNAMLAGMADRPAAGPARVSPGRDSTGP